jgi:hypothetical protein
MNNYEMLEVEKANVRIAGVRQRLIEKQAETDQIKAQVSILLSSSITRLQCGGSSSWS